MKRGTENNTDEQTAARIAAWELAQTAYDPVAINHDDEQSRFVYNRAMFTVSVELPEPQISLFGFIHPDGALYGSGALLIPVTYTLPLMDADTDALYRQIAFGNQESMTSEAITQSELIRLLKALGNGNKYRTLLSFDNYFPNPYLLTERWIHPTETSQRQRYMYEHSFNEQSHRRSLVDSAVDLTDSLSLDTGITIIPVLLRVRP
ncbi:hypothetical protein A2Z33_02210 [Candidatus Gottesmanbacteria bacterium RBG_16_52_11]|uniref:Uncharacterized protein n=1 Tax=Candidatus Gottesmanbacteria bacterium RBG_16_52_11 TaxID=1798374 RepID=A0A1F5YQX5_9BACT|nr:MAG: hypothetical protein A2Z33_02210 [Candidatus Gottesmanbacteria bacterium RBG_16_52_11]